MDELLIIINELKYFVESRLSCLTRSLELMLMFQYKILQILVSFLFDFDKEIIITFKCVVKIFVKLICLLLSFVTLLNFCQD